MQKVKRHRKDAPSAIASTGTQMRKSNQVLSQKRVRELFDYDPDTGIVTRKINMGNTKAGDVVGSKDRHGHLRVFVNSKHYQLHRIIWLWMEGYLPEQGVDHRDRVPWNNKWGNLRLATQQCNLRNAGIRTDNKSGVKGVSFDLPRNKWTVRIAINKVSKFVGRYNTFEDAVYHRLAAEQCLDWAGCDFDSSAVRYINKINGAINYDGTINDDGVNKGN